MKQFAKAKRKLYPCEVEECKIGALGLLRRRPTFTSAKEFTTAKKGVCYNEGADKVQDQFLVRQGKAGLHCREAFAEVKDVYAE